MRWLWMPLICVSFYDLTDPFFSASITEIKECYINAYVPTLKDLPAICDADRDDVKDLAGDDSDMIHNSVMAVEILTADLHINHRKEEMVQAVKTNAATHGG
eukprot:scaffold235138_cov42-Prasinocladus_malaysianus.AAC.1